MAETALSSGTRLPSVALFSAYYTSHGGGMELASEELARRLRSEGLSVTWLAQATGTIPDDLAPHCIPVSGTDVVYRVTGIPLPLPSPSALPAIARTAANARVVIIAEANFILSALAYVAAKLLRKPVLIIQHVGEPSTVSVIARMIMRAGERVATRPMLRNADDVICVSAAVARHFQETRPAAAMTVIGHGVDTGLFRMPTTQAEREEDKSALGLTRAGRWACFVGRLTESKGISVVGALARLRPDWNFAIAGTGPISPRTWGLGNVVPLGFLDRQAVARLYRACDVMVLPSPSESFSLVVREALASGCGVLCSNQILDVDPGLASHVNPLPIDLARVPATAAGFAEALDRVSPGGQAARDYVAATCSWPVIMARYLEVIGRVAAGAGWRSRDG